MAEFKFGPLWEREEEAAIVGRLVLGYTEIEIQLWRLLTAALGGDEDQATRIMFRPKNAETRILVADGILRKELQRVGLLERYRNALGELNSCRKTRNDLAHAYWDREDGTLIFARLEAAAKSKTGKIRAKLQPISIRYLREREGVFYRTHQKIGELVESYNASRLSRALIDSHKRKRRLSSQ